MSSCKERLMKSDFVKCVKRLFFMALWVLVDIGLDIRQTIAYYNYAYNKNGVYAQWEMQKQNATGSSHRFPYAYFQNTRVEVKPINIFFYAVCAIWIVPPWLFIMCGCRFYLHPLLDVFFKVNINLFLILGIITYPFILIYILVPFSSLKSGWKAAMKEPYGDEDVVFPYITENDLGTMKIFEHLGEALPQLVLAIVFAVNNFDFLWSRDEFIITAVSMFFSCISLLYGFYLTAPRCCA